MQFSLHDIFLLQPRGNSNSPYPIFGANEPFKQRIEIRNNLFGPHEVFTLTHPDFADCDRISLHKIIPELGLVIIGTPKGRVAILALFQHKEVPEDMRCLVPSAESYYVFRMDWLLPTAEQEEKGERPEMMLVGIAASPVQGMLGQWEEGKPRKWRLLLTYADHSVLSYEISSENDEDPEQPGKKRTKIDRTVDLLI
jgi:hypothetical protein